MTASGLSRTQELIEERRKFLVMVDGRPFNPEAPAHVHGKSTGYYSWSCRCDDCAEWQRVRRRKSVRSRKINEEVLAGLPSQRVTIAVDLSLSEFDQVRLMSEEWNMSISEALLACAFRHRRAEPKSDPSEPVPATPAEPSAPPPTPPTPPSDEVIQSDISEPTITVKDLATEDDSPPQIPPMTPAVRDLIVTTEDLRGVSNAYYTPDWSSPTQREDRERRVWRNHEIIVASDSMIIYWRSNRDVATGDPEITTIKPKALPKAKGGGTGRTGYTSYSDLIAALERNGCSVTRAGSGHLKVTKDGKTAVLPMTPSDHRTLPNSMRDVKRAGLL